MRIDNVGGGGGGAGKAIIQWNSGGSVAAGTTKFLAMAANAGNENNAQMVVPFDGTLKNLYVSISGPRGAGFTTTWTLRQGATLGVLADTLITVTIAGAVDETGSDVVNTKAVTAGDIVTLRAVSGAGGNARIHAVSIELTPS